MKIISDRSLKLFFAFVVIAACCGWFFHAAITPPLPSAKAPLIFYSNQTQHDLRLVFRSAFLSAQKSIDITMYALTDPSILKWLDRKALTGIPVSVAYDKRGAEIDFPKSLKATALKSKGLMHRKIVIIDDATIFLGSANMTTSSLALHDNLTVGIYDPKLALFLHKAQETVYHNGNLSLHLLPDPKKEALLRLIGTLDAAQKSIYLAMFTLTHPDLIAALIRAHERGVELHLAVDYYAARGASKKMVTLLEKAGISVKLSEGMQLLHHKWALVDEKRLISGSTNWTKAAFEKNHDCLLFLESLDKDQKQNLIKIWKQL